MEVRNDSAAQAAIGGVLAALMFGLMAIGFMLTAAGVFE